MRPPAPIVFELHSWELAALREPDRDGGYQALQQWILDQLGEGNKIAFDDQRMGELVRHMSYNHKGGRGGFQGRLRKAFGRQLSKILGLN